jgi:hypothetical protein
MTIKNTLIAFVLAGVLSGCSARSGHTRNVGYDNAYDIDSESPSTPEEYQADDSSAPHKALTCNETEALLKVRYNFSEDEWNSFRPDDWRFRRFLKVQGNSMQYENFEDVMDFEGCLPKEDCSEIIVAGLPTSAYDISFDGKSVDIGAEFRFDGINPVTSTTVGACEKKEPPTCKDAEGLVEVQYWSGDFFNPTQQFRVEDSNGGVILTGPGGTTMPSYTLKETYACVPKDNACYTFLIGSQRVQGADIFPPTSYSIAFDGQLVSTNDAWPFDSVRFGGSCKPLCNQDNESLVELFMFTENPFELEFEHEWSLSVANHNNSSGAIPVGPDTSPLVHKNICTLKGSCSSFFISSPEVTHERVSWNNETVNDTFIPWPTYSLSMDNITYRKVQLSSFDEVLNQTTNMGSCTVEGLCDEQSQDLFDLELHTPAKFEWMGSEMPYVPSSTIDWNFGYTFASWQLRRLLRSSDYINTNMAYELDSRYRTIECVPKGGYDMSFNLTSSFSHLFNTTSQTFPAVETHSVKKNGVPLLDSIFVDHVLMTPFGTNCFQSNNTLSGGAIAGIVVACVAALAAIVGLIWCKKRQNQQEKGEEDPLHESLL